MPQVRNDSKLLPDRQSFFGAARSEVLDVPAGETPGIEREGDGWVSPLPSKQSRALQGRNRRWNRGPGKRQRLRLRVIEGVSP